MLKTITFITFLLGIIAICNIIGVAILLKFILSFDTEIEIKDKKDN